MTREILFKAVSVDGKWVEGYYVKCGNDLHEIFTGKYHVNNEQPYHMHEVIPNTVCQFTGLLDSNGNKIFDGDILTYIATNMSDMEVKVQDGQFVGVGPFNTHPLTVYMNADDFISLEITGNIHDGRVK